MNIFDLQATISLNGEQFQKGVEEASTSFQNLGTTVSGHSEALKTGLLALGGAAVAAGGAIVKGTVDAAYAADDLNTLSKQTGIATDTLQKFQYASNLIDVPLETMTGSLKKLTMNMDNARDGTGNAGDAFDALGISVVGAKGELRNNEEVFNEVIDALGAIQNSTERDAIALDIFGRSAQELNPLILGGADALKELGQQAEDAGLILSQDALDGLNQLSDAIDTAKATASSFTNVFGTAFASTIAEAITTATSFAQEMSSAFSEGFDTGGIEGALSAVGEVISWKFSEISSSVSEAVLSLTGPVGDLAGAFVQLKDAGIEGVSGAIENFVSAFDNVGGTGTIESITAAVSGLADAFASASAETIGGVAGAVSSFLDGFDSVGTEAIAQITKDAGDLFATFQTVSADLIGTISGNVREFLDVFPSEDIGAVIGGIAQNASELFGAFKMVAGTVIQEIASGIKVFFDGLPKEAIAATIGTLAQKIGELFGHFSGTIAGVVRAVAEAFSGFGAKIAEVWNTVGPDLTKTGEAISSWATLVSSNVGMVMSVLQPLVEYFGSVLSVAIQIAIDQIIATFGGLWNAVVAVFDGISEYGNAFVSLISGDLAGAAEHFKNVWEDIKDFFGGLKDALIEPFKSFARVLGDESNKGVEALKKPFVAVIEWFKDIGGQIVEGLKSGISAAWSGLTSWFTEKCDSLVGGVLDFFGIHSPSTVFAGIGKNLVLGMGQGWGREFAVLERQVEQDLDSLTDTARMKFADSAIGRSSAAGISSNMALYGQRGGDSVEINLVLDGDVAARALYDPLRRAEAQKGMRKEAAYA